MDNEEKRKNSFVESPFVKWFSILLGLLGFSWVCYDHIKENNPNLTFTIVKEVSLLNDRANIPSIHIMIDSIDLKDSNSNISIFTIKIENEGQQHILKNMYDGNIQLFLQQGRYIGLPMLSYASSSHINPYFSNKVLIQNEEILTLPCIPLDKNNAFFLDVFILHNIDSIPKFNVHGKISGQKEIYVTRKITNNPSFWKTVYGGGWLINGLRLLSYFIVGVILIVIITTFVDNVQKTIGKYKLKNAIQKIVKRHPISKQVIKDFNNIKRYDLRLMYKWINTTDDEATKRYSMVQNKLSSKAKSKDIYIYGEENDIVKILVQNGYFTIVDGKITIDKSMQNDFMYLYKRLKRQKIMNLDISYPW